MFFVCPIMLRNILGQIFDSTFLAFLAHFPFFQIMFQPLFYRVFSRNSILLQPAPPNLGTLFVNTTALTDFFFLCFFFCIFFFFFRFFAVSVFVLFLKGRKTIKQTLNTKQQKRNKTTRCKPESHIVLLQKKKADNTDTKRCNFFV